MPIFISYSHKNKDFVDKLAKQLVSQNVHVWVDRWELNIGDSISDRVQDAVQGATAILVVLSTASVESNWCKRELSAGLLRELEEKRIVVMPVLLEDCIVPLFARDKLYADFRTSFDEGLRTIMEGVAKVTNPTMARVTEDKYFTDWSIDYGTINGQGAIILNYVQHSQEQPYSCLTMIDITMSKYATEKYLKSISIKGENTAWLIVVTALHTHLGKNSALKVTLDSSREIFQTLDFTGKEKDENYKARIGTRRLGQDTGKDILVNVSGLIEVTYEHMTNVMRSS